RVFGLGAWFFPAGCLFLFLTVSELFCLLVALGLGFGFKPRFGLLQPGKAASRIFQFLGKFIASASRPKTPVLFLVRGLGLFKHQFDLFIQLIASAISRKRCIPFDLCSVKVYVSNANQAGFGANR